MLAARTRVHPVINHLNSAPTAAAADPGENPPAAATAAAAGENANEDSEDAQQTMLRSLQSVAPFFILLLVKLMYEHALSALAFSVMLRWRFNLDKKFTEQVEQGPILVRTNERFILLHCNISSCIYLFFFFSPFIFSSVTPPPCC